VQSSDASPGSLGPPGSPGSAGSLVGTTLGGYRLVGLLGAGGMAEVYRGLDPALDRPVAVKVLPAHLALDPGYVARFRTEAQRVAALSHPNIVPVYRFGEDRGLLYLVMPVLRESLRERLDRAGGTLPPTDAARLAVQIAAALDAAHAQGVVHRDVKPENILLTAEGRALLTDFGISRELDVLRAAAGTRTLAATGLPVGTPEYMAPEQLRGGAADQRVDVYALGAVLYELLTGHVPHDAPTPYEVAAKVLTERALPPSEYTPAIWPELEEVVLGALAPDPDDRYPDMRSLAAALRRAVLQREASTALVAADPGRLAPTPLARSLATRRLNVEDSAALVALDASGLVGRHWGDTAPPGGRKTKRRGIVGPVPLIGLTVVALVTGLCAFSTLAVVSNLGGIFGRTHISYVTIPGQPGSTAPTVAPTVAAPTATARPAPTATPRPTATPAATLKVDQTSIQACWKDGGTFNIVYTGPPNTVTVTITESPTTRSIYFKPTSPVTVSSGTKTQISVYAWNGASGTIIVSATSLKLQASLTYSSC
jgi:Protein kinase domain